MNAGILPIGLLFLAVGLSLSFASLRSAMAGSAGLVVAAIGMSSVPLGEAALEPVFLGLWISIIATIALVYLPRGITLPVALALGVNAGAWAGALAAVSSLREPMFYVLPVLLISVPGRRVVNRGFGIALKVVGSWVIAVSVLAIFVSLTPTPGYEPDHML